MRNNDIIRSIIAMHGEINNHKDQDIQRLNNLLADAHAEIVQLKMNVSPTQPMTYSLDAITLASQVAMGDIERRYPSKIQAIKAVRQEFGYTLQEAKDLVEAICVGYKNFYPIDKEG